MGLQFSLPRSFSYSFLAEGHCSWPRRQQQNAVEEISRFFLYLLELEHQPTDLAHDLSAVFDHDVMTGFIVYKVASYAFDLYNPLVSR